jgi:hypothetical protein
MKKLFAVTVIFALALAGCGDSADNGNGNGKTTLTIRNLSDYSNLEINYGDANFGTLARGGEVTKEVSEGTRYAGIHYRSELIECYFRTNEAITCEEGNNTSFILTNDTIITMPYGYKAGDDSAITGGLKSVIEAMLLYFQEN